MFVVDIASARCVEDPKKACSLFIRLEDLSNNSRRLPLPDALKKRFAKGELHNPDFSRNCGNVQDLVRGMSLKNGQVGKLRSDSMSFAIIDSSRQRVIRYRLRTKNSLEAFAMQRPTSVNLGRELIWQMGYQADDADPSQPCKPAASII